MKKNTILNKFQIQIFEITVQVNVQHDKCQYLRKKVFSSGNHGVNSNNNRNKAKTQCFDFQHTIESDQELFSGINMV